MGGRPGGVWLSPFMRKNPGNKKEHPPPPPVLLKRGATPATTSQLLSGFYEIENEAWRWTAGKFSVRLRPPRQASRKGATLQLKFSVPEVAIAKLKSVGLEATLNGKTLGRETYQHASEVIYSRA